MCRTQEPRTVTSKLCRDCLVQLVQLEAALKALGVPDADVQRWKDSANLTALTPAEVKSLTALVRSVSSPVPADQDAIYQNRKDIHQNRTPAELRAQIGLARMIARPARSPSPMASPDEVVIRIVVEDASSDLRELRRVPVPRN